MTTENEKKTSCASPVWLRFTQEGLSVWPCEKQVLPEGLAIRNEADESSLLLEAEHCLALSPLGIVYAGGNGRRLVLKLEESARLTLIERAEGEGEVDIERRIDLAPQAKLVHGRIETSGGTTRLSVFVERGAFYDSFVFKAGEKTTRCKTDVRLEGELAEARLLGVSLLRGKALAQTEWNVFHHAPHSVSRQVLKTVLKDSAKAFFKGLVRVESGAKKADGAQLSRAILLSDRAEMRAKPELEIYEDDVRCAHGATCGELDDEALFYLRSRGIPEEQAGRILVRAFVDEVVGQIQSEEMRLAVSQEIEREMGS